MYKEKLEKHYLTNFKKKTKIMKALLLILGLTLGMAFNSYGQRIKNDTLSVGDLMVLSTDRYYDGISAIGIGAVVMAFGHTVAVNDYDDRLSNSFTILGSVIALFGTGMVIQSHSYNKRAGLLLNKNGVGLRIKM
jgi:hypothetical protein